MLSAIKSLAVDVDVDVDVDIVVAGTFRSSMIDDSKLSSSSLVVAKKFSQEKIVSALSEVRT